MLLTVQGLTVTHGVLKPFPLIFAIYFTSLTVTHGVLKLKGFRPLARHMLGLTVTHGVLKHGNEEKGIEGALKFDRYTWCIETLVVQPSSH